MPWEVFFRWRDRIQRATFRDRRTARHWAKKVDREYPEHDVISVRRIRRSR